MECSNVAGALFYLIASHYIFNVSYHSKVYDVLRFIQEKIVNIPSDTSKNTKSPVALSYVNGITSVYESLKTQDTVGTETVSDE